MDVPTAKSLADIYPEDAVESQTVRWNKLISKFKEEFGKLPDFISRSPGRVNIIGEVRYISLPNSMPDIQADGAYSISTTASTKSCPWPSPPTSFSLSPSTPRHLVPVQSV